MNKDTIIKIATEANISKCFSLEEIGINNFAFLYQQAILLVDVLRQSNVPILGGDVYLRLESSIEISYDNWYCDKKEDERDSVFVNRSCGTFVCFRHRRKYNLEIEYYENEYLNIRYVVFVGSVFYVM